MTWVIADTVNLSVRKGQDCPVLVFCHTRMSSSDLTFSTMEKFTGRRTLHFSVIRQAAFIFLSYSLKEKLGEVSGEGNVIHDSCYNIANGITPPACWLFSFNSVPALCSFPCIIHLSIFRPFLPWSSCTRGTESAYRLWKLLFTTPPWPKEGSARISVCILRSVEEGGAHTEES